MKLHISKGAIIKIVLLLILTIIVFLIYIFRNKIMDIVNPFIVSAFIAYLLNPLVSKMEVKGIKRSFGILIIYIIFISFLFFICFYMIPVLIKDIAELLNNLPGYTMKFRNTIIFLQDKYSKSGLPAGMKNTIDNNLVKLEYFTTGLLESFIATIISALSKLLSIALIPILLYYFLKDFRAITDKVKLFIPRKYRKQVSRISKSIDDVFGNYIRTQIILSIIIAVMTTIALLFLKVDFALIIGIINGITNIIPYFGPLIGAVPAVLIALLQSPIKALYTVIILTIIQQIESDIICPKIMSESVGLHPLTVIFALIIGGETFGAAGLILGVPVAAALKIIYHDVMKGLF